MSDSASIQIGAQLVGIAGLAGIIPRRLNPAAAQPSLDSNPPTSSPCQQCREIGDFLQRRDGASDVDAQFRVPLRCQRVRFLEVPIFCHA